MMTAQTDKSYFVSQLPTKFQIQEFVRQAGMFRSLLFQMKLTFEEKITAAFSAHNRSIFTNWLQTQHFDENKPDMMDTIVSKLIDDLQDLPTLTLSLAIEPDERLTNQLALWLKNNHNSPCLIEFIRKQSVIGGAIINFGGKQHDYTLGHSIKTINAVKS